MEIRSLHVKNFRRFDDLSVTFDKRMTVIAARNGLGKTTVLEGVALALGPFVGAFDDGKSEHIKRSDARYVPLANGSNAQQFPVVIEATFASPPLHSVRELRSSKGKTTTGGSNQLSQFARELQESILLENLVDLPIMCYYSSKRLWVHHKSTVGKLPGNSRTTGYTDSLSALSSFNQLTKWVQKATMANLQAAQRPEAGSSSSLPDQLNGVALTVAKALAEEGWTDFEYDIAEQDLVMFHPDHGRLPVSALSDGLRAMATLVADIARRACQLNPHLGSRAPEKTTGIVLIDEVDLHLHPEWQQRVLGGLRNAFPNVQFIVSTHSPQVLSSATKHEIRVISQDSEGAWCALEPVDEIVGLPSYVALSQVMEVDPRPPVTAAEKISEYTRLIEAGEVSSHAAHDLRRELEELYGRGHPVLRDADRLARFQAIKLRRKESSTDA
ncbi:AAA family ATPase [Corynebacterium liangguodongii]|uniref:ATP-binding protein n=1 Tax=Corynebacterium liangguodongii TaxID=2079535 RepID=A0A2S0WG48_9CORY|nr:AAA family ATPase [Corynebacterium liangguodongii]AWB84706.1 ATP-binding protein [Corynebacterium liangguodongii]PWB99714.1 ATP-binding protein [Corynebacterium liangguodongii]